MTFLLELREAAKHTSDLLKAHNLRTSADELSAALDALHDNPVAETMQRANAAWAKAARAFAHARMDEPPTGRGGALTEGAELQRAA